MLADELCAVLETWGAKWPPDQYAEIQRLLTDLVNRTLAADRARMARVCHAADPFIGCEWAGILAKCCLDGNEDAGPIPIPTLK